jgi:hypothetical protein
MVSIKDYHAVTCPSGTIAANSSLASR